MSHTYTTTLEWEPTDCDVFMVPVEVRLEDWAEFVPATRCQPSEGGWGSARVFATVGGLEVELPESHCDHAWLVECAMQDAWKEDDGDHAYECRRYEAAL